MKKFKLITMLLMLTAMQALAMPVDEPKARSIALSYLTRMSGNGPQSINATGNNGMQLLHVEMGSTNSGQPVYYIYNTSTSFLVVAGDDRANEILMIGDRPLMDINNLPPGMQDMLSQYEEEIDFLLCHPDYVVDNDNSIMLNSTTQDIIVGPLLNATWDQKAPYWDQCQFDYNGATYQCLTGCPATSSAMVLHYWKHPKTQVDAIGSYVSALNLSSSLTVKQYTYPELPATIFDWENMKDEYDNYTAVEGNAVATLMRYVGQAVEMIYGTMNAGGSGIYSNHSQKLVDMFVRFGYDPSTCRVVKQENFSAFKWKQLIQNEMIAGRPVVYMGKSDNGSAHAFNVDGYDSTTDMYHVNFGWSGEGNNWFCMNSFSYSNYIFNRNHQAVIGIQPAKAPEPTPWLTVNPDTLSFGGCAVGQLYTQTFMVTGANLNDDVTITSSSESFTVSPSVLTAAQVQEGATVTVTYQPTVAGAQMGTLSLISPEIDVITVSLAGKTIEVPSLSINPNELSFISFAGMTVSKSFAVMGSDLTSDLTLSLNDVTGNYSIDKDNISVDEAANGTLVTVAYHPTVIGSSNASVTISGGGVESKTILLQGEATDTPVINVDVNEVTFEPTYTGGYTSSSTITITGAVNENIQLSWWHGQRASFSLSKQTITPEEAAVGAKVTICFCPERWNSATFATLVISSEGAETVSIPVRGTKINSTGFIIASPSDLSFETRVGVPVSKTFRLYYSQSDGNSCIMVSRPGDDNSSGNDGSNNGSAVYDKKQNTTLNNFEPKWFKFGLDVGPHVVPGDSLVYFIKGLKLMVTGDACFSTGTSFVQLTQLSNGGYDMTVTYNPNCAGEHEATINITLNSGNAKPFVVKLHGTAAEMNRCPSVPNIGDVTNLIDTQLNVSGKPSRDNVDNDVQVNISEVIPLVDQILYRKPQ